MFPPAEKSPPVLIGSPPASPGKPWPQAIAGVKESDGSASPSMKYLQFRRELKSKQTRRTKRWIAN